MNLGPGTAGSTDWANNFQLAREAHRDKHESSQKPIKNNPILEKTSCYGNAGQQFRVSNFL